LSQDWRLSLVALFIQYIGVFLLVAIHWPLMMALTKLVAGWIATILLGMALASTGKSLREDANRTIATPGIRSYIGSMLSIWSFRIIASAMIVLVVFTLAPVVSAWIPGVQFEQVIGALILLGLGLLNLGLTGIPSRAIPALLTVLSGFEIIYAAVEMSTLVAGLLAGVNLGLAMIGAYMLATPAAEGEA
jgi:hypothetical protein